MRVIEKAIDAASFGAMAAGFILAVFYGNGLIGFALIALSVLLWAAGHEIVIEEEEEEEEGRRREKIREYHQDLKKRYQFHDDEAM